MRAVIRRLLKTSRAWDYLLGRPVGSSPIARPARLGLERCEAREQPGNMLDGLLAAALGGSLADPLVAMSQAVGDRALLARPAGEQPAEMHIGTPCRTERAEADGHMAPGPRSTEQTSGGGSGLMSGGQEWSRPAGPLGLEDWSFVAAAPLVGQAFDPRDPLPTPAPGAGAADWPTLALSSGPSAEGSGVGLPVRAEDDGFLPAPGARSPDGTALPAGDGAAAGDDLGSPGAGEAGSQPPAATVGDGSLAAPGRGGFAAGGQGNGKKGGGSSPVVASMMMSSLGTDTPVNTYTTNSQAAPAVAADADGNFVVVWESSGQDGSDLGIYAQRFASDGTARGAEFRVNNFTTNDQRHPSVAMDAAGDFVVAWESNGQGESFGSYSVRAQRYAADGTAQGSEFLVSTYTTGSQSDPSVAMDAAGDFVVAWVSDSQEGGFGLQGIYAQRYAASGTAQGSEFHVNTYTTNGQLNPSAAMDAVGDFVIAWDSFGQDAAGTTGVYAQRYSASGTANGSEFRVNTYTTGDQVSPSAAMDAAGDFVVAWTSGSQDGSGNGVYAQRYAASGTALGSEFLVNTYTTNGQSIPSAAMDADGDFVVAWAGEGTQDTSGIYMAISTQLPRAFVPEWAAAASSSIGGTAGGVDTNDPGMTSTGGVRYADGTVALVQTDLWSGGYGIGWGQARSWTNGAGYAPRNVNGSGMVNTQQPFLLKDTDGTTIALVRDGTRADYYDLIGGVWTERFFGRDKLAYDAGNAQFVLTDTLGHVTTFYDFSTSLPSSQRGGLKGFTDVAGNAVTVTYTSGVVTEMTRVAGTGGSAVTESLAYTYLTSPDVNAGLVASVTLQRKVGTGAYSTVRSVEYAYYNGVESYGNLGDLKLVVVKDASGNAIDTTYHRYYTPGEANGYAHGLKYLVGGEAYDRMTGALGTTLASITDTQLAEYADLYLEYDSAHRVTKQRVAGAGGASSAIAGQGESTYAYTASANAPGANSWSMKTVETMADGTTNTVYTNAYGQVMLAAYTSGTQTWTTFYRYDSAGRTVLAAAPSAVSGYSDAYADLVNYVSGNAQYLSDSDGVLTAYTYAGSTTATASVAGDAVGYLKQTAIQHGETGTASPQEAMSYIKRTANSVDFFFTASDTVYRNDDGTGGQTTSYAYTWQGTTAQPDSITVTLPVVTTAQNGSNAANATTTVYDAFGRPVWARDEAGFITYTQYDDATGSVVKTITDVNTALTSDFTGLPTGWSTPSGGGLHLITAYEVDSIGRMTKTTSPEGRIDYVVYDDTAADGDPHEVRYYAGWNTLTNAPTGPTTVVRNNRSLGYTETLTMSAAPAVSGGRPTGAESISSVQSLSRSYVNKVGQVINSDAYFNLSGLTYSTSTSLGTEGTNFYRAESAYDVRGRLDRTLSTENTIYRTVYDGLSRVVTQWVGTDDTPTSGSWSPTNTAGTNLVKVTENEYDGGGVGNSDLTKVTAYPGGGAAARVTQAWFDWRDRAVAVKDGVEASESTSVNRQIVYRDFDNLDEVTKTRVYDGDGVTVTVSGGVPVAPSSGLLRAQDTAEYDELGRVFRTKTFSVNTTSGAVSTNALSSELWYDARGLVIKELMPGGLVQKTAYDGAGRAKTTYLSDWGNDTGYSDAFNVTGETVVEQVETAYDKDGNVVSTTTRERFHNAAHRRARQPVFGDRCARQLHGVLLRRRRPIDRGGGRGHRRRHYMEPAEHVALAECHRVGHQLRL